MKTAFLCLILASFILVPTAVSAESKYNLRLYVVDDNRAQLKITYPVTSATPRIDAVPTKKGGEMLDGFRELVSATAQDGSPRSISAQQITGVMQKGEDGYFRPTTVDNPLADANVEVHPGDTAITLTYNLFDNLEVNGISYFSFPLLLGGTFPLEADITVTNNSQFEVISEMPRSVASTFSSNEFDVENIQMLVFQKNGRFVKNTVNSFQIAGLPGHAKVLTTIAEKSAFVPEFFKELFDADLPAKINVVIAPLKNENSKYDAGAITLTPDIIIIDPETLTDDPGPYDVTKVFIHEMAHLAIGNKKLFSGEFYSAPWLSEGLATFAEQYITDNYLLKSDEERRMDAVLSYPRKLNLAELKKAYELPFDYDFFIDTDEQSIDTTYGHAGLTFYNLYLHDKNAIKKWLGLLQKMPSRVLTCTGCEMDLAMSSLQGLTGLSREEIMFPHKDNLSYENPYLAKILGPQISEVEKARIKDAYKKTAAAKPVIKSEQTSVDTSTTSVVLETLTVQNSFTKAVSVPVAQLEAPAKIKQSFQNRFAAWIVWLFE